MGDTNTAFIKLDPIDGLEHVNNPLDGKLLYADGGNLKTTDLSDLKNMISAGIKGTLKTNDSKPAVGDVGKYELSDIGTYTNLVPIIPFGSTTPTNTPIVTESNYINSVYWDGVNFTQLRSSIPQASNNIRIWVAQNYTSNDQVIKDNLQYIAPTGATATDVPGVSNKWEIVGIDFEEGIVVGDNLANPAVIQSGKYVNYDTGAISTNAAYKAFVGVKINPSTDYTFSLINHWAWYTNANVFISGSNAGGSNKTITAPANAAYVSFSVTIGTANIMMNKGNSILPFTPYSETEVTKIPSLNISVENTSFAKKVQVYGKNRFNKTDVTTGKFVNAITGKLSTSSSYSASGFMYVGDLQNLALSTLWHIAFYSAADENTFISGREYGGNTIAVPLGAKYARASINIVESNINVFQVEGGTASTTYEAYTDPTEGIEINNLYIKSTSIADTIKSSIITPLVMYWLSGRELNIYFDSAIYPIIADKNSNYYISAKSSVGKFLQDKYRVYPTSNSSVTLRVENKNGIAKEKTISLTIAPTNNGNGVTRQAIVCGDSTADSGVIVKAMFDFFANDVMHVTFLGTRSTLGVNHEGRSGWKLSDYMTMASVGGVVNPFWNGTKFSFSYYLTNNSYTMADGDWFFIQLTINDLYNISASTPTGDIDTRIATMASQLATMISEIKAVNPNIRIGIMQTFPPAISQDATGNLLNSANYSLEYYIKKGLVKWWNYLLSNYDNQSSRDAKVYLIGGTSVIDRVNGFQTKTENISLHNTTQVVVQKDDVHPDVSGYKQAADAYISIIKNFA